MNGMSVSVSQGWYTFTNLGPITTTFTPAPSCTASNRIGLGYMDSLAGDLVIPYSVQCTSNLNYFSGCIPLPTPTATTSSSQDHNDYPVSVTDEYAYGAYYYPGLYCPSGWATVGLAARDAGGSLTSSGILVSTTPETTATTGTYSTGGLYTETVIRKDQASVLKGALEPEQTMVLCCPRQAYLTTLH